MTSLDLTDLTWDGQLVEGGGAWEPDWFPGYVSDDLGNLYDSKGILVMSADEMAGQFGVPQSDLFPGYFSDDLGNLYDLQGTLVMSFDEMAGQFGAPEPLYDPFAGYTSDEAGNIYDQNGTLVMSFDEMAGQFGLPPEPPYYDPFAGYTSDAAGNIFDQNGALVMSGEQAVGQFVAPDDLFPGYVRDAEGNLYDSKGTLVMSADEMAGQFGLPPEPPPPDDLFPGYVRDAEGNLYDSKGTLVMSAAEMQRMTQAGLPPPQDPGLLKRWGDALGLNTELGRFLATLGVGAGGLGLAQLLAGGEPAKIEIPQPPQTAGQKALDDLFATNPTAAAALQDVILRALQQGITAVDVIGRQLEDALVSNFVEEPARSAIRNTALEQLLTIQQGGDPRDPVTAELRGQLVSRLATMQRGVPSDPVTAALQKQLLGITAEGTTNPALLRAFREQQDILQNRMFLAEGPQWAMTTPGIDAATKLRESQHIQQYADWLNTIGALTGPYQAGVGQEFDQFAGLVGPYETGVTREIRAATGLSELGRPDIPAMAAALRGITSPSEIGGIATTNEAALASQSAQDRAAIISAIEEQQARTGLGSSISELINQATTSAFRI